MNNIDLDNMPSMESLLNEQSFEKTLQEDRISQGIVVEKNENGVLLDLGLKAESFIKREDLEKNWDNIKVGDKLDIYLERVEDDSSNPVVSVHKADQQKAWDYLMANYQEGSKITGTITSRVKGGLIVEVGNDEYKLEGFLPGSQVDLGQIRNLDDFVGKTDEFVIIKISEERRNIVLSRRAILENIRNEQRSVLLNELEPKQIRHGVVKNITDFGAFIDLNGMDGLLHITDMSWGRINHPSEMLKVGDELDVMILNVDRDKERPRISLGLKQMAGNPWDTVDVKYPQNSRVHGKVVNVMPYGAFVELEEGIEGLIHVTEMSWTKKVNRASDMLQVGDEVDAVVLSVDKNAKKISLGLRQAQENPWEIIKERYPKGTRIKGIVRNMTGYGAFVQIQDDIDGMIHVSDMSWVRKINHPSEMVHKGQEVEAVILDVDAEAQRISLSMKKLTDDPWQSIQTRYKVGDMVEGKVTKLASFGAFVELEGGIDGLIHISELSDDHVNRVRDVVQVGQVVKARVKNISTEERRIGLSMKDPNSESSEATTAVNKEELGGFGNAFEDAFNKANEEKQAEESQN
jgi:small subunit ribosomal protein S1